MTRHYVLTSPAAPEEIIEDTDAPETLADHLEDLEEGTYIIKIEED